MTLPRQTLGGGPSEHIVALSAVLYGWAFGVPDREPNPHIVSARAGHARASITLDTYSHLMTGDDASAAMQADEMLRRTLK